MRILTHRVRAHPRACARRYGFDAFAVASGEGLTGSGFDGSNFAPLDGAGSTAPDVPAGFAGSHLPQHALAPSDARGSRLLGLPPGQS